MDDPIQNPSHRCAASGLGILFGRLQCFPPQRVGRDIPTTAEIKRMVGVATDTRSRALLLLAAFTGLRSSELRGLRWSDINLSGELHVRQRADKYYQIGAPKSATSRRKVPLDSGVLIPALKQ